MLSTLLPLITPIIGKVLGKVLPGESEDIRLKRLEIEGELIKELSEANNKQLEINKVEASSDNLFKSGWRPTVAWMGVFGLGYTVFGPLVDYILQLAGLPTLPRFDSEELTAILMGLLGLGGYRTFEKIKKK